MIRLAEPKMRSIGESNSQAEAAVTITIDMAANSMANLWTPTTCLTFSSSELHRRGEGKPPANNNRDSNSIDSADSTNRGKK